MIQVDDGISAAGALGREDLTRAREAGITLGDHVAGDGLGI